MTTEIQKNLAYYRNLILSYAKQYQRHLNEIQLLAVSKTMSASKLIEAIQAEQFAFGENYLQEALDKQIEISRLIPKEIFEKLEWHFIGPIQRNKTKLIAENFSWVHSVDRLIIAERLSQQRLDYLKPLNICLQVNFDQEETKSGFKTIEELISATEMILKMPNLALKGLMAIPKATEDIQQQRDAFKQIKLALDQLNQRFSLNLNTLSMGMTHDLESAIAENATIVRVGTGIFGTR